MNKTCTLILSLLVILSHFSSAQDVYKRNESADVQQYVFNLILNDESNEIKGETYR